MILFIVNQDGVSCVNLVSNYPKVMFKKHKGKPLNSTATLGTPNSVHQFFTTSKNDICESHDSSVSKSIASHEHENVDFTIQKQDKRISRRFEPTHSRHFSTHGADNPIEIDDSDDEVNELAKVQNSYIDVFQITIGADHSRTDCKLMLLKNGMKLLYTLLTQDNNIAIVKSHNINAGEIEVCYYYLSTEQDLTFAILRVKPTDSNGLIDSKNYLEKVDCTCDKKILATNGYIVLDLASRQSLELILDWFHEVDVLRPLGFGNNILTLDECSQYAETMLNTIDVIDRMRNRKRIKKSNSIILVYPFEADEGKIEMAAENLNEAKHVLKVETSDQTETQDIRCGKPGF
jgi:hypothetical protein